MEALHRIAVDDRLCAAQVPCYLNLDTLYLHANPPSVVAYRRAAVDAALGLPTALLPLLGSLIGNDFVPTAALSRWHSSLMPERHAHGSPLIEAVAAHLGMAAAAVGWRGPRPMTPVLWCALDFGRRLTAPVRATVCISLEQYAVGTSFDELPQTLLSAGLGASVAMARRFRRAQLDSMIYSAATRGAIWRGPSLDDPAAMPTILASRPLRQEVYAACCPVRSPQSPLMFPPVVPPEVPPEVSWRAAGSSHAGARADEKDEATARAPEEEEDEGDADAAATTRAAAAPARAAAAPARAAAAPARAVAWAAAHPLLYQSLQRQQTLPSDRCGAAAASFGSTPSAAASDGAAEGFPFGMVQEHVVYHGQPSLAHPEAVPVPSQLHACETMWSMAPPTRCSCFLSAYARAARHDTLAARLEPSALLSLGPIALTVLAVRYMRRHALAPRVVASALLCQGLVMAWLAATRQRLPAPLRQRPTACAPPSLAVVHAAQLFLRVAVDLNVLNSACGAPLPWHGAWEWFDGVLFEGMLRQISASGAPADFGDWRGLLRGDATLYSLFEALRPLALALEPVAPATSVTPAPDTTPEGHSKRCSGGGSGGDAPPSGEPPSPAHGPTDAQRALCIASRLWHEAGCSSRSSDSLSPACNSSTSSVTASATAQFQV